MYYILYSSNKAREKNIKKIIRKRKYIHSAIHYLSKKKKKSTNKWAHTVQTHVVQCQLYFSRAKVKSSFDGQSS